MSQAKIPTFVSGLDEKMGGGVPKGHVVLVSGPTGSMKTTFAFNILHNLEEVPSIYITLEQNRKSLMRQMRHFGMDIPPDRLNPHIVDVSLIRRKLGFLNDKTLSIAIQKFVTTLQRELQAEIVVIDSLESLYLLLNMTNPRNQLFNFCEGLRDLGITTFLISEMDEEQVSFGIYGCETFLSDSIIHLSKERVGNTMGRLIRVVKMREEKHAEDFFPLIVDKSFSIVVR